MTPGHERQQIGAGMSPCFQVRSGRDIACVLAVQVLIALSEMPRCFHLFAPCQITSRSEQTSTIIVKDVSFAAAASTRAAVLPVPVTDCRARPNVPVGNARTDSQDAARGAGHPFDSTFRRVRLLRTRPFSKSSFASVALAMLARRRCRIVGDLTDMTADIAVE